MGHDMSDFHVVSNLIAAGTKDYGKAVVVFSDQSVSKSI